MPRTELHTTRSNRNPSRQTAPASSGRGNPIRVFSLAGRIGWGILWLLMIYIALQLIAALSPSDLPAPRTAAHQISPDSLSAPDLAHRYGYQGDWRAYAYQINQLNPGLHWGRLHTGQQLTVPDYR